MCGAPSIVKILRLGLVLILYAGSAVGQEQDWKRNLDIAAAQHEVILTLIEEGRYDQVLPEMRKIFNLKFPPKYQDRLTKEIRMIGDALLHKGRDNLALKVIQEGLKHISVRKYQAQLYQEMGYIHRKAGNNDKALECFKKAADLLAQ